MSNPCEAPPQTKNIGLRGIVVADSNICKVEGEAGRLSYRGFDVLTLAEYSTFEEVVHLLLQNSLPTTAALNELKGVLNEYRAAFPVSCYELIRSFPIDADPMDVLQAAIPLLGANDPELKNDNREAATRKALRLVAQVPLVITAFDRYRKGLKPVDPDPSLSHAGNLLYTLTGDKPSDEDARDMDLCLILHAEHSFNASTFSARQVASTQAHMYAAVSAAVGSLSGPLHGGANTRVIQMLRQIGTVDRAEKFVKDALDGGGKIMGLGHAVYKTLDPRAKILAPMAKRFGEKAGDSKFYEISEKVREITQREFKERKGININPNVDFYSATVYHMMGFADDLFTPLFAISRVSGWSAHVIEEKYAEAQPKPALYRPRAEYSGRYCGPEGCDWVPMDKR